MLKMLVLNDRPEPMHICIFFFLFMVQKVLVCHTGLRLWIPTCDQHERFILADNIVSRPGHVFLCCFYTLVFHPTLLCFGRSRVAKKRTISISCVCAMCLCFYIFLL